MATERMRRLFRDVRRSGIGRCVSPAVPYAYRTARTLARWRALERLDLAQVIVEPDDTEPDWEGYDQARDGEPVGTVAQYRITTRHPWVTADSVWGHTGYEDAADWRQNPYVVDEMAETISAFRTAWKLHVHNRCPKCRGTGRAHP